MKYPRRGEVWLIDLGMTAKVRPCVVVSIPFGDEDRAIVTVVPRTTSTRGTQFEAPVSVSFLRSGAFDAQGLVTVPVTRALRLLGPLNESQMRSVEAAVCKWLGLPCASS
ncbi:MAG TPA: type II toxin-antitoxin system PemK/MazF family toxin [Thermoanaerobaculia bacterium]|nr:type II toxin-antitoxin system PemK/MazF family toxin [Thermoanaerobaculia bacterium]